MLHETERTRASRGRRLFAPVLRTAAIGGVAALLGIQLFSAPVSVASAGHKAGFGHRPPRAGGPLPAYCLPGSNLNVFVTNAPGNPGTLPSTAPYAQFTSAILLGTQGGSQTFQVYPPQVTYTVSYINPNTGVLTTTSLGSGYTFTPPFRDGITLYTVTGTYTCSDSTTRSGTASFFAAR